MKKLIIILFFFIQSILSYSQFVSTFFSNPAMKVDDAMVLDNEGNLYGSHFMGSNIYKVTPSGVGTIFASGFNTPNGLAFDSQQNLYVCDLSGNRIYKLSSSGTFLDTFNVSTPSGIIKSINSDTMLFTQYTGNKLSKLAPDGTISIVASGLPMVGSVGLTYNSSGLLYVANFTNREIYSFSGNTFSYVATVPGPSGGALGFITFAKGSIWATSYNGHKIYRVYQNYLDSVLLYTGSTLGSVDGPLDSAKFNAPNGIISSISGDSFYVSDFGTGRIRIIRLSETVGLNEFGFDSNRIEVYPNPTSEFLKIRCPYDLNKIEIINTNGSTVLTSTDKNISVGNLPTGVYILKLYHNQGWSCKKFIKE